MNNQLAISQALSVFFKSIEIVIGPTPPGTGVIKPTFDDTLFRSTSPTILYPFDEERSFTLVIPTSIIDEPSFIISPLINSGIPIAEIMISDSRHNFLRSTDLL